MMKRRRIAPPAERNSISERSYDLLGEIILETDTRRLMAQLEEDRASGADAEMERFFAERDGRFLRQIDREVRRRHPLGQWHPFSRVIAALMVVMVLFTGVVDARSEFVRKSGVRMVMAAMPEKTMVAVLGEDGQPVSSEGYRLTYIPSGFELYATFCDGWEYRLGGDWRCSFDFSVCYPGSEFLLGTEDMATRTTTINGMEVTIMQRDNVMFMLWLTDDALLRITSVGVDEQILSLVAAGVEKVPVSE